MSQSPNLILNALPQEVFAALQPHLKVVNLTFGEVISKPEQSVSRVYFPHLGVISLVVEMEVGDMIETAMVGRDGVVNATSALDGQISLNKGIVQAGGVASAISPNALRAVADRFGPFRSILIRHEQVLLAQAQQSAGCNATHSVEARMCRWLLRIRDLVEKPKPADAPSNLAITGRYVLPPAIFGCLERTQPGAGGEIQLTDALKILAKEHGLWAYIYEGISYDAGEKLGFLKATVELALLNKEFGEAFRGYLKSLKL